MNAKSAEIAIYEISIGSEPLDQVLIVGLLLHATVKLPETTDGFIQRTRRHLGKRLEKLKSYDDDHAEHSRGGEDWRSWSMQRNGEHCMHKVHKSYKYTVQRREGVVVVVVVAIGVCCGDSCVKKKESAAVELNRRGSVQ
jgi:hypothetical protein